MNNSTSITFTKEATWTILLSICSVVDINIEIVSVAEFWFKSPLEIRFHTLDPVLNKIAQVLTNEGNSWYLSQVCQMTRTRKTWLKNEYINSEPVEPVEPFDSNGSAGFTLSTVSINLSPPVQPAEFLEPLESVKPVKAPELA